MRLHSPLPYLRRHGWLLAILALLVAAYFIGVGWVAGQLRSDLARTIQLAPAVQDHQHRPD